MLLFTPKTTEIMTKHTLYIVTYDRGTYDLTGRIKPYHWSFFIATGGAAGSTSGTAFQLHGMPGAFYYSGPEQDDLSKAGPIKEKLEIGEVDEVQMSRMHDVLMNLTIDTVESSGWNCQDWTLAGLQELLREGMVFEEMTRESVRYWLRES